MIYNISMKIEHMLENEQATAVFDRFLPGMRERALTNPQALTLSIEQMVRYTRIPQAEKLLSAMNDALDALNTPENAISPSEAKQIAFFKKVDAQDKAAKACADADRVKKDADNTCNDAPMHHQDAIYPGQPWLDTKGERIQAHGGAVYYEDGVYYWYGENKEHTDGKNGIWTWGLKVYSSTDLCNWEDRWLPHYHVDARIADILTRTIACNYAPDKYQANDEERAEMYRGNILETANTSVADYVWLPIQLDAPCEEYPNGRVCIEWKDSWSVNSL